METEKMENRMENRMDFLATSTFSDSGVRGLSFKSVTILSRSDLICQKFKYPSKGAKNCFDGLGKIYNFDVIIFRDST